MVSKIPDPPEVESTEYDPLADPESMITVDELAAMLHLVPGTLAKWRSRDFGPPWYYLGPTVVRYKRGEVLEWIREQPGYWNDHGGKP